MTCLNRRLRLPIVSGVFLLMTGLLTVWQPVRAGEVTFEQDFREPFVPTRLQLVGGSQPTRYCQVSPDGLRCTIPPGEGQVSACGVEARFTVRGDFEIIAGYRLLDVPDPDSGHGAGVKISIRDTNGEWASLQRIRLTGERHVFSAHRAVLQSDGKYRHSSRTQPAQADSGRLKVVREGDRLIYLVAEGDSTGFIELRSETFTHRDLKQLYLALQTGDAKTGVDAVWTGLLVRAESFGLPESTVRSGVSSRWLHAAAAIAVVLLLVTAGLFVYRRWAR